MIGDKRYTEALDAQFTVCGRGAFSERRSRMATEGGVLRRENADMSNERGVRNTPSESPRPIGVGDG